MSRKGKAPAFLFYAADWLADMRVSQLTLSQKGAYIELLCYQWREGWLPGDTGQLARMLKISQSQFAGIWEYIGEFFPRCQDGALRNPRLEKERAALTSKRERLSKNAKARWEKHAIASSLHMPGNVSSSSSSIAISNTEEDPPVVPQGGTAKGGVDQAVDLGKPDSKKQRQLVDKHLVSALSVLAKLNEARKRVIPNARDIRATYTSLGGVSARLDAGRTLDECLAVIANFEAEVRERPDVGVYFDAVTPWRPDNFERKLTATAKQPRQFRFTHVAEPRAAVNGPGGEVDL